MANSNSPLSRYIFQTSLQKKIKVFRLLHENCIYSNISMYNLLTGLYRIPKVLTGRISLNILGFFNLVNISFNLLTFMCDSGGDIVRRN